MSDNLVKRLRATCNIESTPCMVEEECRAALAAADRIEELEAKLAKAVEALGRIADDCAADYPPSHGAIKHDASTTLAELKGQDDE